MNDEQYHAIIEKHLKRIMPKLLKSFGENLYKSTDLKVEQFMDVVSSVCISFTATNLEKIFVVGGLSQEDRVKAAQHVCDRIMHYAKFGPEIEISSH